MLRHQHLDQRAQIARCLIAHGRRNMQLQFRGWQGWQPVRLVERAPACGQRTTINNRYCRTMIHRNADARRALARVHELIIAPDRGQP